MQLNLRTVVTIAIVWFVFYNFSNLGFMQHTAIYLPAIFLFPFLMAPIVIYFTQRMPVNGPLEMVPDTDPTVPVHHASTIAESAHWLAKIGFKPISSNYIRSGDPAKRSLGTIAVFQNEQTSDFASVLGIQTGGSLLGFARSRNDGSRIRTVFSTQTSFFASRPGDDVLRLKGVHDPNWLWLLHCARVANDSTCVRNPLESDLLSYQSNEENLSTDSMVRTGYFIPTANGTKLRITIKGAVMSTLKGLWPTSMIFNSQNASRLNTVIKSLNVPTEEEYRDRSVPKATRADEFKRSQAIG